MPGHEVVIQTLGGIIATLGAVYVGWRLNRWDKDRSNRLESLTVEAGADATVEVAAIKMMEQILASKEAEIKRLSSRIDDLERRIEDAEIRYREVLVRLVKYEKDVNGKTKPPPPQSNG